MHAAWAEIKRCRIADKKIGILNEKFEQWRNGSAGAIREWLPKFVDLGNSYPDVVEDPIHWAEDSVWKTVGEMYEIQKPQEDEPLPTTWSVNRLMVYWFAVASEFTPQVNVPPLRPLSLIHI